MANNYVKNIREKFLAKDLVLVALSIPWGPTRPFSLRSAYSPPQTTVRFLVEFTRLSYRFVPEKGSPQ